jgi:hypothetical protein
VRPLELAIRKSQQRASESEAPQTSPSERMQTPGLLV